MRILLFLILTIFICPVLYANNLNIQGVPVTKTSVPFVVQNGSMIDTGTDLGAGNVGVNSTNPGQRLDVQGTIRMTGLTLTSNGGTTGYVLVGNGVGIGTWSPFSQRPVGSVGGWLVTGNNVNESVSGNVGINTTAVINTGTTPLAYGQLNITAINDSFFFGNAGNTTSTGSANTAVGTQALLSLTSGIQNTSLGSYTNALNTTGSYNTAIGADSLYGNGNYNTGVGVNALGIISTGSNDTCIGYNCLVYSTTGNYNVAIGNNSGLGTVTGGHTNVTGTEETFLGSSAYALNDGDTNETVIGYGANGSGSNTATIGGTGTVGIIFPFGNVGINSSSPGSQLDVQATINGTRFFGNVSILNGNVGIGSSNPGKILDVQGSLRLPQLKSNSGARYVCVSTDGTLESSAAVCVGT